LPNLPSLPAELAITIGDGDVWVSIGLALLFAAGSLAFGVWVSRAVGLLDADAPAGEVVGVGLTSGLVVLAALWAAIWSRGGSSFTPVAIGFVLAMVVATVRRLRRASSSDVAAQRASAAGDRRPSGRTPLLLSAAACGLFITGVALLYGSTLTPSPRAGAQPVEFSDEAFYSVLGRDLAATGVETIFSPSGFSDLPGFPEQTWYHWGELWLASGVITAVDSPPLAARHFIVLPVLLLAAAALTGTLVRRLGRTRSRRAYVFGVLACLLLAPLPSIPIPYFSASNVGLIFGITTYGLAAAAVLLALYCFAVFDRRRAAWQLALFGGSAAAFILPSHIAMGFLAAVGVGSIWAVRVARAFTETRRLPYVSLLWRRTILVTVALLVATVIWGAVTEHGQAAGGPHLVSSFNSSWLGDVAVTTVGGGAFFAILVAWLFVRRNRGIDADVYLGTMTILLVGALVWGARLGEFTMFHVFYGAIAVFATPVAAIAIRTVWGRLRSTGHGGWAVGLAALTIIQLEFGVVGSVFRLQAFGPNDHRPTPLSILAAIQQLPAGSKLAYSCARFEEIAFNTPRLLSIDAHTGQRVVPMCFSAEVLSTMIGADPSAEQASLYFEGSPQRILFPDAGASPMPGAIASFLKSHGIDYVFADREHPNTLVPDAVPIAGSGDARVLRIP
jgi:hypothetical protein